MVKHILQAKIYMTYIRLTNEETCLMLNMAKVQTPTSQIRGNCLRKVVEFPCVKQP
jgi:hypothetical protein